MHSAFWGEQVGTSVEGFVYTWQSWCEAGVDFTVLCEDQLAPVFYEVLCMMFILYVLTTHDLENSLMRHWAGPEGVSLGSCDLNCMLLSEWLQAKWPAFLHFV